METAKILEKYAPQFVALDEAFAEFEAEAIRESRDEIKFRKTIQIAGTLGACQTRALLDAYAQALVKLAEHDWQPIETAPEITAFTRIGPHLDLWSKSDGHVPNCFFDGALNVWMQRICYMGSDGQRMTQFQEVRNPTHWRPRPAPPKQEEAK